MLKLKRLTIKKFRHVEPTELVFDDRYTVPLGLNGSGKTTLLKLISACLRSDFSAYKDEEFHVKYAFEVDGATFTVDARNEFEQVDPTPPSPKRPAGFELPSRLRSSASMILERTDYDPFEMRLHDGFIVLAPREKPPSDTALPRPAKMPIEGAFLAQALFGAYPELDAIKAWQNDGVRGFPWDLLQASQCYRFDESLETLSALTGVAGASGDAPPTTGAELLFSRNSDKETRPFMASIAFLPEELRSSLTQEPTPADVTEGSIKHESDQVTFLRTFVRAAGFSSGKLRINLARSDNGGTWRTFSFKGVAFRFQTANGSALTHELLSYGQKRLLSFLYYVACNDSVVVADELVNGLHHAWIEVCLDAIGERQAFLTSQNPLLLDFLPPASPEEAQRRFIRCVPEERDGRDVMVWRNLTPDEAKELCTQYNVGIQQLSELLRVNGLW
jgi:energy-coupling factor transporter ATP-binding protein EcfA2